MTPYGRLVLAAFALTLVVVVFGAYVRLAGAGLGCPDWPGCYGEMSPAQAQEKIDRAVRSQGGEQGPASLHKAWTEMGHRYLAGTLGLVIVAIAITASLKRRKPVLAWALVVVVVFQAALGMWTVTLLLKPVVVTLHLLGGMLTLGLLAWLAARELQLKVAIEPSLARPLRQWAALALATVFVQIALGGWVSSNYAALACVDFPTCHGTWLPDMDFRHGFQLVRELGRTAAGTHLAYDALTAIHWTHRAGAVVTLVVVGACALALARGAGGERFAAVIAALLAVQIGLGITSVLAGLPLAIAVAHNGVAALLLASLVLLNFALSRSTSP